MIAERSLPSRLFDAINIAALAVFSVAMAYPLLYIAAVSISNPRAVAYGQVWLWPVGFDPTAFRITFLNPDIWRAYANSVLYAAVGTFLILLLNSLTAFPLSVKTLRGRNLLTVFITVTMFFSGGMIPTYLLVKGLGLIDTLWAVVLPGSVGAWTIIVFRTNFEQIPTPLLESAAMDGAKAWTVYLRIVLPLSKPILATLGLFGLVGIWNNFFTPMIYLNANRKAPLQVYLRSLIVSSTFESAHMQQSIADGAVQGAESVPGLLEAIKMAAVLVSTIPILCVYPFIQRYFVKGVLLGSIKG